MDLLADKRTCERMRDIRRALHKYPELAYQEVRTAALVANELDRLGMEYRSGLAGTGIIGVLKKGVEVQKEKIACVALRADMDALPIQEENDVAYTSRNAGIMHACGHDGHVAMLLGAAAILKETDFNGRIIFLFQPAEESGNGAAKMVDDGALEGVDMIFAGHIDTHYPVGKLTVDEGLICSYTDPFTIHIRGRGGHAARPHEAVDSIVVASNLVMSLQTLVSRQIDPAHAAVVTVGRFEAGTVHNAIAEHARLEGTVRSAHVDTRASILSGLKRVIQGASDMSNAEIRLDFFEGLPAVLNDKRASEIARIAAGKIVGAENVISQGQPSLGGEDFAFYQQKIPGCLIRFGADKADSMVGPSHSCRFDFNEDVLAIGASWLAKTALTALAQMK